jgi:hypothetical protein
MVDYIINHRVIWLVGFMVFIATFINISVMYRGGQLDHLTLYTSLWMGFELTTSVVIGTDCIGSCKFNYHAITSTTAPQTILPSIMSCEILSTRIFHKK